MFNDSSKLPDNVKITRQNVIQVIGIKYENRGYYYCSGTDPKLNRKFMGRSTVGVIGILKKYYLIIIKYTHIIVLH